MGEIEEGLIEELQYDLCEGCGERSPVGQGIFALMQHGCPRNTVTYRVGKFGMRQLREVFERYYDTYKDPFEGLLDFPSFSKMPDYETATPLEKRIYNIIRESDVRSMKRLRAYMELEDELNSKW